MKRGDGVATANMAWVAAGAALALTACSSPLPVAPTASATSAAVCTSTIDMLQRLSSLSSESAAADFPADEVAWKRVAAKLEVTLGRTPTGQVRSHLATLLIDALDVADDLQSGDFTGATGAGDTLATDIKLFGVACSTNPI
jgi:hypothetical protein